MQMYAVSDRETSERCMLGVGRVSSPVGRAAFKAVGTLEGVRWVRLPPLPPCCGGNTRFGAMMERDEEAAAGGSAAARRRLAA